MAELEAPDLGNVGAKIKKVPPIVWVAGGGILLFLFFMSKGGSSSGATGGVADAGGGGDGSFEPSIDQEVTDLFALIRADSETRASWQSDIDTLLKGIGTPGGTGGTGGTGGSGGGGTSPSPLPGPLPPMNSGTLAPGGIPDISRIFPNSGTFASAWLSPDRTYVKTRTTSGTVSYIHAPTGQTFESIWKAPSGAYVKTNLTDVPVPA